MVRVLKLDVEKELVNVQTVNVVVKRDTVERHLNFVLNLLGFQKEYGNCKKEKKK